MSRTTIERATPSKTVNQWGADGVMLATMAWLARYPSPHTRRHYIACHREFTDFLALRCHIDRPEQIERVHVDLYARALEDAGYAPNSRALKLAGVTSWLNALVDQGMILSNPATHVKRPERDTVDGTTKAPDTDEVRRVIEWLRERNEGVALAVELMARHALRIGSVSAASREDVIRDSSGAMHLRVPVKGGRVAIVRIGAALARRIDAHMEVNVSLYGEQGPKDPVLIGMTGLRVSADQVREWLRSASRACGLVHQAHPHAFRTWAITTALDSGVNIDDAATFAMHRDVRTTRRYDRRKDRRLDQTTRAVGDVLDGEAPDAAP